jgi:hypothetical protein
VGEDGPRVACGIARRSTWESHDRDICHGDSQWRCEVVNLLPGGVEGQDGMLKEDGWERA